MSLPAGQVATPGADSEGLVLTFHLERSAFRNTAHFLSFRWLRLLCSLLTYAYLHSKEVTRCMKQSFVLRHHLVYVFSICHFPDI